MRKFPALFVAVLVAASVTVPAHAAAPRAKGYSVGNHHRVARGLTHTELRARGGRGQVVHVARMASGSNLRVRPVPSRGNSGDGGARLERTSTLCRRVDCLVAVNGDFFREGRPVGGLVSDGRTIKPPRGGWVQAVFDPASALTTRRLRIRAEMVTTDLKRMRTNRVDPGLRSSALSVYTSASGWRTPRGRSVEAIFRIFDPRGPLRVGQTSVVRLTRIRDAKGSTRIPNKGMILRGSGSAGARIRELGRSVRRGDIARDVLLRLSSTPEVWDTVGGRPVLVRNGRSMVGRGGSSFVRGRHPRTLLGRARDGSVLLVTVDGRQRGRSGMSLAEAARLMIRLGAVEAINLDGGGSTSFVVRGRVRNRPSDGRERPVAVALAIVRGDAGTGQPSTPSLKRMELGALPSPEAKRTPESRVATRPAASAVTRTPEAMGLTTTAASVIVAVAGAMWRRRRLRAR